MKQMRRLGDIAAQQNPFISIPSLPEGTSGSAKLPTITMEQGFKNRRPPMRSTLFVILGLATLAASVAEARPLNKPAPLRPAGTLTCVTDPSLGLIVGSTRAATCTYASNYGRFSQVYAGRLSRVGFDVGLTSGQMISWRISTPGGRSRSNMLNGLYSGSSAEATLLVGPGSQFVFNERGDRILIEPIGHTGQAGFGLAFGASALELSATSYALLR
jgi:hypothetical protein